MSLSSFANITTALIGLLSMDPPVSAQIFRARDRQLAEQFETAINVQFDGAVPVNNGFSQAPVDWESRYTIECYARTTTGSADLAVDPLLSEVFKRIAADVTLGDLVMDIGYPLIEAEYTSEQVKTGWVRMTYPVRHRTSNLTLEPQ
jgi:hypothetical protein